jgi:hypothetical protein
MYCKSCLAANPDDAVKCGQCGAPLTDAIPAAPAPVPPATAASAPSPAATEFELQPEHTKAPDAGPPPSGPPLGAGEEKKEDKPAPPRPKDYKTEAILLMVGSLVTFPLCCLCGFCLPIAGMFGLIFGLLALLEAQKVKPAYEEGNFEAAEEASKNAYKYFKLGLILVGVMLGLALVFNVVMVLLYGVSGFMQMNQHRFNQ